MTKYRLFICVMVDDYALATSAGDILCLCVQFASAQCLPRSLLPLCTIRGDCFSATSIFQNECRCWSALCHSTWWLSKTWEAPAFKVLSRRIKYYKNASCTFNPAVYKIRCSGDVETNPGYVPECTLRS